MTPPNKQPVTMISCTSKYSIIPLLVGCEQEAYIIHTFMSIRIVSCNLVINTVYRILGLPIWSPTKEHKRSPMDQANGLSSWILSSQSGQQDACRKPTSSTQWQEHSALLWLPASSICKHYCLQLWGQSIAIVVSNHQQPFPLWICLNLV